ncbi:MAG: DegT/DnrJ/EryC1/StrS aminotransferase family protein [Bacteroidales bacterium]|jgi:dTDP-4-amino-4,6-dideoxygalactose transaminase
MIPFSPPYIDDDIINEVVDTLKSGWITTGPKTKLFEKEITDYCGCKSTVCVNSATIGLELVLKWFGVTAGDEVIIPAYTYCATANAVVHCGAKPVMVDINKEDFNINAEKIADAITSRTKVIIPVDIGGLPCDYDEIYNVVNQKKILFKGSTEIQKQLGRILILSDAAHSFGAKYKGIISGALSDVTVFSFHAVKNLTTSEGGAITFNLPETFDNKAICDFFTILILHGQNKDALSRKKTSGWKYDVLFNGYKANMTDVHASIGLVQLKKYKYIIERRQFIFKQYSDALSLFPRFEIPIYKNYFIESSYHLYLLRILNITENMRDSIIESIFNKGVSVNVHFQPLPMLTVFKNNGYSINDFPVSYEAYSREISLPVHMNLSDSDVSKVIDVVFKSVHEIING